MLSATAPAKAVKAAIMDLVLQFGVDTLHQVLVEGNTCPFEVHTVPDNPSVIALWFKTNNASRYFEIKITEKL